MKKIYIFLLLHSAFCFMLSSSSYAQCTDISVSYTTTPATCHALGIITAHITGADAGDLIATQFRLTRDGIPGIWLSWGTGNTQSNANAPTGSYTIDFRGLCGNGDIIERQGTATVTGDYIPFSFSAMATRKTMSCKPTGVIGLYFYYGYQPYQVVLTNAPAAYTGPTSFTVSGYGYNLNNVPAGIYDFTATDGCFSINQRVTVQALSSDVPSLASFSLERASVSNCNTLRIVSPAPSASGDWTYYWQNSGDFYEIAHSKTSSPVASNWQPLTSLSNLIVTLPDNFQNSCPLNQYYFWIRVKGCTETRLFTSSVSTKVCNIPATVGTSNAAPWNITFVGINTCDNLVDIAFDSYYGLCYPATWIITEKDSTTVVKSGTFNPSTLATNSVLLSPLNNPTPRFINEHTYTITLTDATGRVITKDFFVPLVGTGPNYDYGLITQSYTFTDNTQSCKPCGLLSGIIARQPTVGAFAKGTTFTYVSGPSSTVLPWGPVGTTITSNNNESYFRFNHPTPLSSSSGASCPTPWVNIPAGNYTFRIIEPCNGGDKLLTVEYRRANHGHTVTQTRDCTPGVRVAVNLVSPANNPGNLQAYFRVVSGPDPNAVGWVTNTTNHSSGQVLTFPMRFTVPGTYRYVEVLRHLSAGSICTRDTFSFNVASSVFDFDKDNFYAFRCSGTGVGFVGIRGKFGMPHSKGYTYTLFENAACTVPYTPTVEPNPNNTGDFTLPGIALGAVVYLQIKDSCSVPISFPVTMYGPGDKKLIKYNGKVISNISINDTLTFCAKEPIQISTISLGEANLYKWIFPDNTEINTQTFNFIATPDKSGWYKLELTLNYCNDEILYDSVYIKIHDIISDPQPLTSTHNFCAKYEHVDIVALSGLTPDPGNYFVWYTSPTSSVPISPPTNILITPARTLTYYVAQYNPKTDCYSGRILITVNIIDGASPALSVLPEEICVGGSAMLSVEDNEPGTWKNLTPTIASLAGNTVTGLVNGIATFTFTPADGCVGKEINLVVTSLAGSIFYDDGPYCTDDTELKEVKLVGESGGTFTATPAGLSMDAYGTIDPSKSISGIYEITYTQPSIGDCIGASTSTTVEILLNQTGTFSYPDTIFCVSDNSLYFPVINFTPPATLGAFAVEPPTGLPLLPGGIINPSLCQHGSYTITYTPSNHCGIVKSFKLYILDDTGININLNDCLDHTIILEDLVKPYFPDNIELEFFDSDGITPLSYPTEITSAGTHNFFVKPVTPQCISALSNIKIVVAPKPVITLSETAKTVCEKELVTVTGTFANAGGVKITTLNGNGNNATITTGPGNTFTVKFTPGFPNAGTTVEIVLSSTNADPCETVSESLFVTVTPKPVVRPKVKCNTN